MSGYCPVGKMSCVYFDTESYNSPVCRYQAVVIFTDQLRVCPLPTPVVKSYYFAQRVKDSFSAGRIAGLREAVEAVDKLDICGVCGARMLQLDPCKTIRDECGLYGIYETFLSKYQDALRALEMKP